MPLFYHRHTRRAPECVRHQGNKEAVLKNMFMVLHFVVQWAPPPNLSIGVPTGNFFHKHLLMKSLFHFESLSKAWQTSGGYRAVCGCAA